MPFAHTSATNAYYDESDYVYDGYGFNGYDMSIRVPSPLSLSLSEETKLMRMAKNDLHEHSSLHIPHYPNYPHSPQSYTSASSSTSAASSSPNSPSSQSYSLPSSPVSIRTGRNRRNGAVEKSSRAAREGRTGRRSLDAAADADMDIDDDDDSYSWDAYTRVRSHPHTSSPLRTRSAFSQSYPSFPSFEPLYSHGPLPEEEYEDAEVEAVADTVDADHSVPLNADANKDLIRPQYTPTCSQALRMHWQSVALSVRFGVFRTKRRMRGLGLSGLRRKSF